MADAQVTEPAPEGAPAPARRRPRLALWAVLAVLAVGAGAVAVAARDDDPPRLPIALGAGSGQAPAEADAGGAAMTMLAPFRYVAGDDLPELGGDGPAYRLADEVDLDRLREVAAVLGVDGEVEELDRGSGTWQIEGADGSTVGASAYGGGQWWYAKAAAPAAASESTASGSAGCPDDLDARACEERLLREREAAAVGGEVAPTVAPCPPEAGEGICDLPPLGPPQPRPDLPSREDAEHAARDLFRALGVDVRDAEVTVDGPGDAWYVTFEPRVDGWRASGYALVASVGTGGQITSAGGVLSDPDELGRYPMLGTRAALERFEEQVAGWSAHGEGVADVALDCAAASAAPSAPTDEVLDADDPPAVGVEERCAPVPQEPVEVVLHDAEAILMLVPSFEDDRSSYLVPGYRMRGDDGQWVDVLAVDDGSLVPAPVEPRPVPLPDPEAGPRVPDPGGVDRVDPSEPVRDPDAPVATEGTSGGGGTAPRQ